jgi:ATP-dependent Clp protease ATP-binding subunit ClpA
MRFDKLTQNFRETLEYARPVKRTLKGTITDVNSNGIISGNFKPGEAIEIDYRDEELVFRSAARGKRAVSSS